MRKEVKDCFNSIFRTKGQDLFNKGRVTITERSADKLRITVRARNVQTVDIERLVEDSLEMYCTCSTSSYQNCHHLWAGLLAAEEAKFLTSDIRFVFGKADDYDYSDIDDYNDDDDYPMNDQIDIDDGFDDDNDDDDIFDSEDNSQQTVSSTVCLTDRKSPLRLVQEDKTQVAFEKYEVEATARLRKQSLEKLLNAIKEQEKQAELRGETKRQIVYSVGSGYSGYSEDRGDGIRVSIFYQERKVNGEWGKLRTPSSYDLKGIFSTPLDREIFAWLSGSSSVYSYRFLEARFDLPEASQLRMIRMICESGRCLLAYDPKTEPKPLYWDSGPPWIFRLEVARDQNDESISVNGFFTRGNERIGCSEPLLVGSGGVLIISEKAAQAEFRGAFALISLLRREKSLVIEADAADEFLKKYLSQALRPEIDLPSELSIEWAEARPKPILSLRTERMRTSQYSGAKDQLRIDLCLDYDGLVTTHASNDAVLFDATRRFCIRRDIETERGYYDRLIELGFKSRKLYDASGQPRSVFTIPSARIVPSIHQLIADQWTVQGEGRLYRKPGKFRMEVTSEIDWFDLRGEVDFDGVSARLPDVLASLKRGTRTVVLDDGSLGMLPEEWFKRYGLIASLGKENGDAVRYSRTQAGFLDALIASEPEVKFDKAFARIRKEIASFAGIKPGAPPPGFHGKLRTYQRDGLGWFSFLRKFGFGGCLADCMGLGKTVMALALLESRRKFRASGNSKVPGKGAKVKTNVKERLPPSLLLVPRSLIFNWMQEAARFTPELRVLDHTGSGRMSYNFADYDLVVTTYGTMRRDIVRLKDYLFDYVILDEAQAIKNSDSDSAKCARLLKGNHRLALTGTPVENHLGELWSLLDFLNPGMLGTAAAFRSFSWNKDSDKDSLASMAKALRPFLLRRTKEQVASDLPTKLEQTIYCEMSGEQALLYAELRNHYRASLSGLINKKGIKQSKIQILEALLRLRQAACHPALLDPKRGYLSCGKMDILIPRLSEVMDEGHKALVFSQFTSFLGIVRKHLDLQNTPYEYLDGKTRDRESCVRRFQENPYCKLFLISLKAGGFGLNLTEAEYVFLLDPWWNPAVESQAIDRTHRIGQTKPVFAYRLITKGTVEEKVLELQKSKRELADAIINGNNSLMRGLEKEDLEFLLS